MRIISSKFKTFVSEFDLFKNISNRYFLLFFFLYFTLGCYISYQNVVTSNIYFGADNYRAFGDLTELIFWNHYRIKVHPLFLLFTQPITLLIKGIFLNPKLAVVIIESLCGAFFVKTFYLSLEFMNLNSFIVKRFSLILGFSFSFLIFSTTPETFIFSGLSSCLFFQFLIKNGISLDYKSNKNLFILSLFATLLIGMIITNYILFFIGIVVTLCFKNDIKIYDKIKVILKIFCFSFFITIAMCCLQKLVWNSCPIFISSIIDGLTGKGYEETLYINTNFFSLTELKKYILLFFFYPLISPSMQLTVYDKWTFIEFTQYHFSQKILVISYVLLCFVSILYFVVKVLKKRKLKNKFPLVLSCTFLIFNFFLHFLYGKHEAFIYSCNYLYLVLISLAIMIDITFKENSRLVSISKFFITFLIFVETINNLHYFEKTQKLTNEILKINYEISQFVQVISYFAIGCLISFFVIYKIKNSNSLSGSDSAVMNSKTIKYGLFIIISIFLIFELLAIAIQAGGITGFLQAVVNEFHLM